MEWSLVEVMAGSSVMAWLMVEEAASSVLG
jgi:hypothetical protein